MLSAAFRRGTRIASSATMGKAVRRAASSLAQVSRFSATSARTTMSGDRLRIMNSGQHGSTIAARCSALSTSNYYSVVPPSYSAIRGFVSNSRKVSDSSTLGDSFLNGTNGAYVDEMYLQWRADPTAVHKSWDAFFSKGQYVPPPDLVADYDGSSGDAGSRTASAPAVGGSTVDSAHMINSVKMIQLVRAFQVRGHFMANLDPLGLNMARRILKTPQELTLEHYGINEADLDVPVNIDFPHYKGFLGGCNGPMTVRKVYDRLKETYCGSIGAEYMHIADVEKCNWIREQMETPDEVSYSKDKRMKILDRLAWAHHFEAFVAKKYVAVKRFGLEGAESMIPGMKAAIDRAVDLGVNSVVIGMPHRGRLNVLNTVIRKPLEQIFCEFAGNVTLDEDVEGSGDVKYHLGMSLTRTWGDKEVSLSLVANPSHLEAVNPVVNGKTRAKQFYKGDTERKEVMAILLHGDAAFAGQGIVYESLGFSDLPEYTCGGTIHIVVNNQVGFTTNPSVVHSGAHCTEVAKAVGAPIFHVNGDDPDAVVRVCEMAAEWRAKFKKDVVIDLVCYRRHGHNEIDEPAFTQPQMYTKISSITSTWELYRNKLVESKVITDNEAKEQSKRILDRLESKFEASKTYEAQGNEWLYQQWDSMRGAGDPLAQWATGTDIDTLKALGPSLATVPDDFNLHSRLKTIFKAKEKMFATGEGFDWATAEALAFATLLKEKVHVRLSGQDVERGTFSHRHAVLHDQKDFDRDAYVALNNLGDQAHFTVANSHLSEYGVLGFELGYSLENPNALVLWEGQFGDFCNTAQVIIDQFLSSGEFKWRRQSGLVMLLPHGYEGQGPEHSSARLERFLQLSSDHPYVVPERGSEVDELAQINWQVINCTTPANYFHALRRQVCRNFRKPLIVMSPKSLLRHKMARSSLEEMSGDSEFQPFIADPQVENARRLILCSGKVYYELLARRDELGLTDVAISRCEQLTPFPRNDVIDEIKRHGTTDVVWCQEEPMNMGAWTYVRPRIEAAINYEFRPRYAGRAPSASTATGNHHNHNTEIEEFLKSALE
jgi:2-oxoglutarate dehydrogenase E1 component